MRLITIILLIASLNVSAQNWKVSITPTNLAFNSLTIGIEKDSWETIIGIPVAMSLTYPFERYGIQRSDYSKSNMSIASFLIGHKSYSGNFYYEPYAAFRLINCDFIINSKPGWPVNSSFLTNISTSNIGLSLGYQIKLSNRIHLNCFIGPELCLLNNIRTSSKSVSIEDRDWMYNYYIPHEYHETFPSRLTDKLFIRRDGYDVYACVRNVIFWNVRGGIGIVFELK